MSSTSATENRQQYNDESQMDSAENVNHRQLTHADGWWRHWRMAVATTTM